MRLARRASEPNLSRTHYGDLPMARILIHRSHPVDAKAPITGFSFTVEYGEGSRVRFADLPIPPSSDEHSVAAFRQELRRFGHRDSQRGRVRE
jgi:hypothetical protein